MHAPFWIFLGPQEGTACAYWLWDCEACNIIPIIWPLPNLVAAMRPLGSPGAKEKETKRLCRE